MSVLDQVAKYGFPGVIAVVVLYTLNNIIKSPTFLKELGDFIARFSKPKKDIDHGGFVLVSMTRHISQAWVTATTWISTVADVIMIFTFVWLLILSFIIKPLQPVAGSLVIVLLLLPSILLVDMWVPPIRSTRVMKGPGDTERIIRFCQKRLFDIGATFVKFSISKSSGEIQAITYHHTMTINVTQPEGIDDCELTLSSECGLVAFLLYSANYKQEERNLFKGLFYPS
jgi:hypothetical protein